MLVCKVFLCILNLSGSSATKSAFLPQNATEHELQSLVDAWKAANPHIVQFWWNIDHCVKEAIRKRTETETNGIRFLCKAGMLFIVLPSGRRLSYVQPRIGPNKFGGESITSVMSRTPDWMPDIQIIGDGYEDAYYRKD